MSAERYDVLVIGGGANGLTAAAALSAAGRRVLVLESGEAVGGQSRAIEFAPGFRAAPLADEAGWVPPAVARLIGSAGLSRTLADVPLSVAPEPGRLLELARDPARAAQAIARFVPADAPKWPAFVALMRRLAGVLERLYERPAPAIDARLGELAGLLPVARRFRGLGRDGITALLRVLPMPVEQVAGEWFELDALRAAVSACGIRGIRQGPRSGGTGFVLVHHLAGAPAGVLRGRGDWTAGPDAFVAAAQSAAARRGATIRTGARVAAIAVHDYAVRGVVLEDGDEIAAPCVLSTADPARTFALIDPVWLDPELLHAVGNIRYRGSTACVLYALDRLPPLAGAEDAAQVLHGTVSLTGSVQALERAADAAKYGTASEPPHVELSAPSLRWSAHAPAGAHVLVARVRYAPYRLRNGGTWDAARANALAAAVDRTIEAHAPGFADGILHRNVLTPADLEARYGLTEGAASHGELALDQVLFMRPVPGLSRYALPIAGLYLGGAGAHPGPGVTGGAGLLAAAAARTAASP